MKRGGPLRRTPLARAAGLSRGTTGMARKDDHMTERVS
jgi:hypothetical protein